MNFYERLQIATADARAELISAPIINDAMSGKVTREQYLDFLARAFHHVKHTAPLLMACGSKLPDTMEWLRTAVAHYIEEEIGHHEWILNDIAAVGGDAEAVRKSRPDFDTDVMVAYAYDTVMRRNPAGLFGMVFVLEGTSVRLACSVADTLAKNLNLPATAFSYLSSHGALDVEHMGHFEKVVNRLDRPEDQQAVIDCANVFFRLYGNVLRGIARQGAV
ncbi:MAG TPA: iron-containing redox enzyme family protein [Rhodocyclaceae bacterium]|nr:iron-containing redox enzyme family protein [Rhodocyclaceae bacterium]